MEIKTIDLLIITLVLVALLLFSYFIGLYDKKATSCLIDPYTHLVKELKEANPDKDFVCTCSTTEKRGKVLVFNEESKEILDLKETDVPIG